MIGTSLREIIRKSKKNPQEETHHQIKILLDSNPSALEKRDKLKQTPIYYAVKRNAYDILELLVLTYNADLSVKDRDGKKVQAFAKNEEMVNLINELKGEVKRRKHNHDHLCDLLRMLHKEPENEHYYRLKIQKRISANPHEVNEGVYQGRTACHWAVLLELPAILELLVSEGAADLHQKDKLGKSPLDYAKNSETKNIVSSLIKEQDSKTFSLFFTGVDPVEQEKEFSPRLKKLDQITQNLEGLTLGKLKRKRRSLSEPLHKYKDRVTKTKNRSKTETENNKSLKRSLNDPPASLGLLSEVADQASHEETIIMAIDMDDDVVLGRWLEEKENPNNTCHNDDRPYILHAFLQRATKCFLLLLLHDADIKKCNNTSQNVMSFLEEGRQEGREKLDRENLDFILSVLNKLNTFIDLEKINTAKERIAVLEEQFNRSLISSGLNKSFNSYNCRLLSRREILDIIELQGYPKPLVKRIYECCSGVKFSNKNLPVNFNMLEFRNTVIGLLTYGEQNHKINISIMVLNIVSHFYHHHFKSNQKLMSIMLIKEMIKWINFTQPHKKALFKAKLNEFMHLTLQDGLEELNDQLMNILGQRELISNPYIDAHHQLNAILNRAGYSGNTSLRDMIEDTVSYSLETKDATSLKSLASLLANEMRALSLQFYQLLHRREFLNKGWAGNTNQETSPNIVHHQLMFNNLVQFLKYEVLTRNTENERAIVISLYIMTIEELLNHEVPDYNMAMAVSAALNDSNISRLKRTFGGVPARLLESWENIKTVLSERQNYKYQRDILKRNPRALTFLGIYTRDVTFIYDGNNEKSTKKERYSLMGNVYHDIFQRQNFARTIFIQFKTDLPTLLKKIVKIRDSSLYEMSILLEPPILYLTPDFDRGYLEAILKSYIHNKQALQVQTDGELKEGIDAVEAIYKYIENLIKQRSLKVNEGNHLIALACKAAGGENMSFNSLQYNLRLNDIGNMLGDDVRELLTLIGSDRVKIKLKDDDKKPRKEKGSPKDSSDKKTLTVAIEVTIKQNKEKGKSYILREIRNEEEKEKRKENDEVIESSLSIMEDAIAEGEWQYGYNAALLNYKNLYDGRSEQSYNFDQAEEKGKEKEHQKVEEDEKTVIEYDISTEEGSFIRSDSELEGSGIKDDISSSELKETSKLSPKFRYL